MKNRHSAAPDHDSIPPLTVTQEDLDKAEERVFGPNDDPKIVTAEELVDGRWIELRNRFYQERVVHVEENNVLLLRFAYTYEVDLDRIKDAQDLLSWVHHLCEKDWMNTERLRVFIETVAQIKGISVTDLG